MLAGAEPGFAGEAELRQHAVERLRQRRDDQIHVAAGQLQRLEAGASQKFEQAAAREELKVFWVLQFADGETDHAERAIEPKRRIRRRQHQPAAGLEHAEHLAGENFRRRHVLDHLGAEREIEGAVRIIDAAFQIDDVAVETVAAIARDPLLGDVDAADLVSLCGERQRVAAGAAADVEDIERRVVGDAIDRIDLAGPGDFRPLGIFPIVKRLNALVHGAAVAVTETGLDASRYR